ncbi:MAG: TatD family hydrolase [Alphaproteobacteria bacterium]|nr:TatD family hydrolase [Alphaproteobacteria bacterium]
MFIDSHCHLEDASLNKDIELIIESSNKAGVNKFISIHMLGSGSEIKVFRNQLDNFSGIYGSIGKHPDCILESKDIVKEEELYKLSCGKKIVAIGETGFDFYRTALSDRSSVYELQKANFETHIKVASELGLPLILHSRDSDTEMIDFLTLMKGRYTFDFILHCFCGGEALKEMVLDLGGYIGLGGIITFGNRKVKRERELLLEEDIRSIPIERICLETDSPYLSPHPNRGKRNDPSSIPIIAKSLSIIHSKSLKEVEEITTRNTEKLFKKLLD